LLGVFYASVFRQGEHLAYSTSPSRMEFLWVRWLGVEPGYRSGFKRARLPKVGFVPQSDNFAFGFLDPANVVRGAHLIPDFRGGRTTELLDTQNITAARAVEDTDDWANYYVDVFADRDMMMRFFGGGIGHMQTVMEEDGPDDEDSEDKSDGDIDTSGPSGNQSDGEESDDEEEDADNEEDEEDDAFGQEDGDDDDFGPTEEEADLVEDLGFAEF
ncbi:hypothetical protein B0H10DRAFT_1818841, partial [Mycena sp. CBHHK59/15]